MNELIRAITLEALFQEFQAFGKRTGDVSPLSEAVQRECFAAMVSDPSTLQMMAEGTLFNMESHESQ